MFYLTPGVVDVSMMEHNHEEHTRRFWVRPEDLYQVRLVLLGSQEAGMGRAKGRQGRSEYAGGTCCQGPEFPRLPALACLPSPTCPYLPALTRLP